MAANNNIDEDDMLQEVGANNQSAFDSIDVFKPKLYKKDLSFGKRRSFLCFSKYIPSLSMLLRRLAMATNRYSKSDILYVNLKVVKIYNTCYLHQIQLSEADISCKCGR